MLMFGESDADNAGCAQGLGFLLHAGHGEFAGVVEGLGELRQLEVAPHPPAHRVEAGDAVDAAAEDEADRSCAGAPERPEILSGEVAGKGPSVCGTVPVFAVM